jgi:SAM-dependent methyltransferase
MICPLCQKTVKNVITSKLRGGENMPVYYCSKCDLGMLAGGETGNDALDFYRNKYRKIASPKLGQVASPKELFEMARPFQQDRIRLLKKHFGKNKRLLEIGCSAGMFLWHAKDCFKEVVGIDYDKKSADFARKKCGCRTYWIDIENTDLKENYFDMICAFQTLEHVSDPIGFIDKHKEYLKPGGLMAIEVPNLNDALAHIYNLPNHERFFYHISHLWYFTERSLEKLMSRAGFQGTIFHIQDYNLFNHINWIINDKPQPTSTPGLSAPILSFRKSAGDNIKTELSKFMINADNAYKKILADLKISSNIFYIGKKI